MSPSPSASGLTRPAAVVNGDIRALLELLREWAAAVRAEVTTAA